MEWNGKQQLLFLMQSSVIGIIVGLLFDGISGYFRGRSYRNCLFVADVLLGLVAAIITFFGALVITDGYLHPVLFVGSGIGFVSEHYLLGQWLSLWFHFAHTKVSRAFAYLLNYFDDIFLDFQNYLCRTRCIKHEKPKKAKKTRKNAMFFQKNS